MTGSNGNCAVATISDNKQVVFDFGTGAFKECCRWPNFFITKVDNILITHNHADHNGDWEKISAIDFKKTLPVMELEVLHNIENRGFAVLNKESKEIVVYMTDYYKIPDATMAKLCALASYTDYKLMFCLELSYNEFLYKKMNPSERIGLDNHCSDVLFFHYAKQILEQNPKVNIITLHASGRIAENWQIGSNADTRVCRKDYCRQRFFELFPKNSVRFGEGSGFCANYNYIEL